eukprot:Hpha_TRINITY_DN16967_c0_g2::TRINITY_DN16967_c0_g2_i3::g.56632::m.56632
MGRLHCIATHESFSRGEGLSFYTWVVVAGYTSQNTWVVGAFYTSENTWVVVAFYTAEKVAGTHPPKSWFFWGSFPEKNCEMPSVFSPHDEARRCVVGARFFFPVLPRGEKAL